MPIATNATQRRKMMIRGLQKQMLWLSTPKSRHFELVCFILRPECCRQAPKDAEILREAKSLLLQAEPKRREECAVPKKKPWRMGFLFGGGVLCGCLGTLLVVLLSGAH